MASKQTLTNNDVIAWAIEESGYNDADLAGKLSKKGIDVGVIEDWRTGTRTPTAGQLTELAKVLRRPRLLFYLPQPPTRSVAANLRETGGSRGRSLTPSERFALREAQRRQRFVSDLLSGAAVVEIPAVSADDLPEPVAATLRKWSGVSVDAQRGWRDDREAYRAWRSSLEEKRILVMELQLGKEGIRGFALSDSYAPVVAVNTAQNEAARSFTLWHEIAHLCLKAEASCLDPAADEHSEVERWCEEVASAVLMPPALLEAFLAERARLQGFNLVAAAAKEFRTSLRAAAIALMRIRPGLWDLYRIVEAEAPFQDHEKQGGGRGGGQPRAARRLRESGRVASQVLVDALAEDRISELEARRILKLDGEELSQLSTLIREP